MGTTDRKFSREICIANLTCPFISTLSLHYVWPTHQPSRAASSVTDLKVSQTTRHTFPVSNLPCAYLSCYLLTYYQPNGGSRALVVNDKSKNVFFRGRKEVLMNVNGTLDFSINSATTRIIYIYIYERRSILNSEWEKLRGNFCKCAVFIHDWRRTRRPLL